jgi:hypothetical protein
MTTRRGLVKEVLKFAKDTGLDLGVTREDVPIGAIVVVEGVDPDAVRGIVGRLERSDGWPDDLPLVVLASNIGEGYLNEGYMMLDGHHRLAAAEEAGYVEIPALVVSMRAYDKIASEFDVPRVDYINFVLAASNPLIAENVKKGVGGRPKRRAW